MAAFPLVLAPGSGGAQSLTSYTYDSLGRSTAVTRSNGFANLYSYDPADNRGLLTYDDLRNPPQAWTAQSLYHTTGYTDGDGWAGDVNVGEGFLTYGPYTSAVPVGSHLAAWKMLIDNNTQADGLTVVQLQVYDYDKNEFIATRDLIRQAWAGALDYEYFTVPFTLDSAHQGDRIELRTYFHPYAYVRVGRIGVS